MEYYSFHPKKNQAFRLYFSLESYQVGDIEASTTFDYIGISKDGATFDACANTPVEIPYDTADGGGGVRSWGRYYIDLTAEEMNCDFLIVGWSDNVTNGKRGSIYIRTSVEGETSIPATVEGGGGGSGITLDTVIESDDFSAPIVDPTVGQLFALLSRRFRRGNRKI